MIYIFAAVCFVLLVMNLFMLFVLRQMVRSTGRRIKKDTGQLFAAYDELVEKESLRLEELIEETEALRVRQEQIMAQAKNGLSGGEQPYPSVRIGSAPFQEEDFPELYRKIRREFEFAQKELVRFLERKDRTQEPRDTERRQLLQTVRGMLGFDALYQISTMPQDRQREIMKAALTGEEYGLYQEWEAIYPGRDVIGFADWLEMEYAKLDTSVVVRLPEGAEIPDWNSVGREKSGTAAEKTALWDGVHFQTDLSICEGIRICCQGRLYDYSI